MIHCRHEGWHDDGNYSGANMERPGLKQIMADIEDGNANVVVVYKVDRLTHEARSKRKRTIVSFLFRRSREFYSRLGKPLDHH